MGVDASPDREPETLFAVFRMDETAGPFHIANMRAGLLVPCVCFGLYLLFAGTLSWSETLTGVVLAGASGVAATVLIRTSPRHFAISAEHVSPWSRALAGLLGATLRTGRALATVLLGRLPQTGSSPRPFDPGKADDPADRARRATAVLALSLSPDTFVVEISPQRGEALLHGLDHSPSVSNPEWLV